MDTHKTKSLSEEILFDSGMSAQKYQLKHQLKRLLYFFISPQRWKLWLYTLFLDLKYSRAYLGIRAFNGNSILGYTGSLNSSYQDLNRIFSHINIKKEDIIIDVGSGKGRAFNFLLSKKISNSLIGIEVDPSIATVSRKRFRRYGNVHIITGSVETIGVLNGTIFYLANPFYGHVLENFANQLLKKIKEGYFKGDHRPLIIYYYCYHLSVFENNPEWEVKKLEGVLAALIYPAQNGDLQHKQM